MTDSTVSNARADAGDAEVDDTLLVESRGGSLPFSKGLLSQSLLATAMDVSDATAVARAIERELVRARIHRVDRKTLRDLAHDAVQKRLGDEMAERYLLWRRYQEPERPVVLLLAGTSGVGKTSLSLEVARRLGIAGVQSTDSIRQIMRLLISADLVPAIHASSYDAYLRLPATAAGRPTVIDGFRAQAAAVAIGVRASIERTIAESANLVMDGVSIVPDLLDLDAYKADAEVIVLLITARDEESLRGRFHSRASGQGRRAADRYVENIEGILEIQRHLIGVAERLGVPVIDNLSFDQTVRQIIGHVMAVLRGAQAADVRPVTTSGRESG